MEVSKIEKLRKIKKISQEHLCHIAKISKNTYYLLINGKSDPLVSTVEALAKALGCDVGYLFTPENKNELQIAEEPQAEYGYTCDKCKQKDEILRITNMRLISLQENNDALIKTNLTLNNTINSLTGDKTKRNAS